MTDIDVKRLAAIESIKAKIEGMKAENAFQLQQGWTPSYGEGSFFIESENLQQLALLSDDNVIEFIKSLK